MKASAKKVRRIFHDRVVVGFAGSVADAFSLCERFEEKMQMYGGSLTRAAVALAQDWRNDKVMRKLEDRNGVQDAGKAQTIPFALLAAVALLWRLEEREPRLRPVKWIWLGIAVVFFILMYPAISGLPCSWEYAGFIEHVLTVFGKVYYVSV